MDRQKQKQKQKKSQLRNPRRTMERQSKFRVPAKAKLELTTIRARRTIIPWTMLSGNEEKSEFELVSLETI